MWQFERSSLFKKQYKLLGHVHQSIVNNALEELEKSVKPELLGVFKPS